MVVDRTEYERWLAAATSSLRVMDLATDAGEQAAACFHAEQAAQLGIKGLLHGLGAGDRGYGHNVVGLGHSVEEALDLVVPASLADALARLARHYIPTRYPDAVPGGLISDHYRRADAEQARADALTALSFVADAWAEVEDAASDDGEEP